MSLPAGFQRAAKDGARVASAEARGHVVELGRFPALVSGRIVEDQGEYGFGVSVLDSAGNESAYFDGVLPMLGGYECAVGDEVLLVFDVDVSVPRIMVGSGGDGMADGYFQGARDLGFGGMVAD